MLIDLIFIFLLGTASSSMGPWSQWGALHISFISVKAKWIACGPLTQDGDSGFEVQGLVIAKHLKPYLV